MTKFTKSPWRIKAGLILAPDGRGICAIRSPFTARAGMIGEIEDNHDAHDGSFTVSDTQIAEAEANAQLVSVAPELLEACKAALWEMNGSLEKGTAKPLLEAAIAKAEGIEQNG